MVRDTGIQISRNMLLSSIIFFIFICKEVIGQSSFLPEDLTVKCAEGWYQYGEKCFKTGGGYFRHYVNWNVARDRCINMGGELASIHSKEEYEFLIAFLMLNTEMSLWIGLNDLETPGKYVWTDGSPFDFSNWDENEPSDNREERCSEMRFNGYNLQTMGRWNHFECHHTMSYLCQMPINPVLSNPNPKYCSEAAGGGYRLLHSCFHYISTPMTWSAAEEFCKTKYDGHLVSIQDQAVYRFVNYILQEMGKVLPIWIGIKASNVKGSRRWSSGWYVTFESWTDGSLPSRLTDGECVSRLRNGYWDVRPCNRKYEFVCEVSSRKAPKLEPSIEGYYCPTESSISTDLGGDYCYFFENHVTHLTWHETNFTCMRKGGTLASIHSEAEMRSIEQFIRYKAMVYFIGFFRKEDLSFIWTDGSQVDYTRWDDGSPGNIDELCTEFRQDTLLWNDIGCGERRAYICSVKKIPPNITVTEEYAVCSGELLVID